jgi:hypothetical protein
MCDSMDSYRSVYDQPLVRGLMSSVAVVFAMWALFVVRNNDPVLLVQVLQPTTLVDWLWLIGALSAAHLAGFLSGLLRTSRAWPVLSLALTPLYWVWATATCGQFGTATCQSAVAPVLFFFALTLVLVVPIVLLSGIELALEPRRRKRSATPWPRLPTERR